MKRIFAIILASVMLLSCMSIFAFADGEDAMEIVNIEIQEDDKTVYFNFTCKADNVYNPANDRGDAYSGYYYYSCIRIVNNTTDWELQYLGEEPVQWGCYNNYPLGYTNGETMSATMSASLGCSDLHDIFKLVREGGRFEGCVVAYCIEECGTCPGGDGLINNFFEQGNSENVLVANKTGVDGAYDGIYVELIDPYLEADIKESEEESKKKAEQADETTVADVTTAADTTATEDVKADDTAAANDSTSASSDLWIYIAAGAILVVAVVVVIIIVKKRK